MMLIDEAIERLRNLRIGWGNIPLRVDTGEGFTVPLAEFVRTYEEEYDVKGEQWRGSNAIVIKASK